MNIVRHLKVLGLAGTVLMAAAPCAFAQQLGQSTEPPSTFDRIEKSLSDAASEALDYIQSVIPYTMPEVQPNGDIVIRRQKPDAGTSTDAPGATTPAPAEPDSGTSTTAPGAATSAPATSAPVTPESSTSPDKKI